MGDIVEQLIRYFEMTNNQDVIVPACLPSLRGYQVVLHISVAGSVVLIVVIRRVKSGCWNTLPCLPYFLICVYYCTTLLLLEGHVEHKESITFGEHLLIHFQQYTLKHTLKLRPIMKYIFKFEINWRYFQRSMSSPMWHIFLCDNGRDVYTVHPKKWGHFCSRVFALFVLVGCSMILPITYCPLGDFNENLNK